MAQVVTDKDVRPFLMVFPPAPMIMCVPEYAHAGVNRRQALPVVSFAPNALGLYDMAGNIYEWCSDWYGPDHYASGPTHNPRGASEGINRVIRGGGWLHPASMARCVARAGFKPTECFHGIGSHLVTDTMEVDE